MGFAREFFELQLCFAEKAAAAVGIPLERALLEYTNLYVRLGLGRDFDPHHDTWRAYLAGLHTASDRCDWTHAVYLKNAEANTAPPVVATFGCFSYALQGDDTVRLHFRSADLDGESPLHASRIDARRAELAALFMHVSSSTHPDVVVVGSSWLYNLPAYRRLFPSAYVESRRVVQCRFQSMSLWGQLLDHRGQVKPALQEHLTRALAEVSAPADLERCFPLQVLRAESPLRVFQLFYAASHRVHERGGESKGAAP